MKHTVFSYLGVLFCGVLLVGCADPPVGSRERPFTMYFVPSVDTESIATRATALEKAVSRHVSQGLYGKDEGFYVKAGIPTSYVAVVEALGTRRADFAVFNTFAYVLAKDIKGYDIEPMFTVARGPGGSEDSYRGQIIARSDSGVHSIEDLAGKRFAYSDPASTTGFILPSKLVRDRHIQLGEFVFAQTHPNVVTMVYQGRVDAGATYHSPPEVVEKDGVRTEEIRDARYRVLTQYPDVEEKIEIIALTDPIPNEPWVIRKHLYDDPEMDRKVRGFIKEAIEEFVETEEGKALLWTVATGTGILPARPEAYDRVRQLILESELDLESALEEES